MTAGLGDGMTVLIHGGGSGIGTMAIQVARLRGARVAVTASRDGVLDRCRQLGADITINYADQDFVEALQEATAGRGADVILDVIGAKYLARNISALADGGRLVIIGLQGGTRAELDLNALMRKRAGVIGTTLRSRPVDGPGSKSEIVADVRTRLWPLIADGSIAPVIDSVIDLPDAATAHARVAAGGPVGKVLLRVPGPGN
jgi:NADPH:quinone reductase-like Zn-dependent oxidoreductase